MAYSFVTRLAGESFADYQERQRADSALRQERIELHCAAIRRGKRARRDRRTWFAQQVDDYDPLDHDMSMNG
jgi:hypothetical protein